MEKQDANIVKAFLKKASELEISLHKCKRTIEYLEEQAQWYSHDIPESGKFEYGKWFEQRYEFPNNKGRYYGQEHPPARGDSPLTVALTSFFIGLMPSIIITVILGIIYAEFSSDVPFVVTSMILTCIVLLALITFIRTSIVVNNEKELFQSRKSNYISQLNKRNELLEKEKFSYEICQVNIAELVPVRNRLESELKEHYAQGVVADKYCNIIAVTQMYEYFELERCDTLTGPFGAYNLFESELRANIIIMQLDKIQQNQRMIYSAILELTAVIDSIGYEIGALRNDIASSEVRILGGINEINNSIKSYGI